MQGVVISVEDMQFDGDTLVVQAVVEDAALLRPETHLDPAEWGPGLCRGTMHFSDDDLIPATDAELMDLLSKRIDDWSLMPADDDYPDD